MDTRNKSGYDDVRAGMPGADPNPDSVGPFEIRLNPSYASCPQNPNRTAMGRAGP